jgi:hypothetical protein
MSIPPASNHALPPVNAEIGLIMTAADHLIPIFKTGSIDSQLAQRMAVSAIDAYRPESRADFVNVARTIAFSMAALALLGKAISEGTATPEQMRTYGRAIALNRSADQSERTMMQRRRHHRANLPAGHLDRGTEPSAAENAIDDAGMVSAIDDAVKEYTAARFPAATEAAAAETRREPAPVTPRVAPPRPPTVVSPILPVAATPEIAIHHSVPRIDLGQPPMPQPPMAQLRTAQSRTAAFKEGLLNHTAIQCVLEQSGALRPV